MRWTSEWTIDCGWTSDVDPLVRHPEEVVGLDHLEALVDQGGGVDRDPAAHLPGGMGERLLRGHLGEIGAAAEGPAGSGQHQPLDRSRWLRADQLIEGRVLGVDRDDPGVPRLRERGDQLAADHQRLLVGERQVDPLGERDDRRAEARRRRRSRSGPGRRRTCRSGCGSPPRRRSTCPSQAPRACSAASVSARATAGAPCRRACSSTCSQLEPAERPATASSSLAAITSSAWVPIEPVDPSISTRFTAAQSREAPQRPVKALLEPDGNANGRPGGLPFGSIASQLRLANGDRRELELLDPQVADRLVAGHREGVLAAERRGDDVDPGTFAVVGGVGRGSRP